VSQVDPRSSGGQPAEPSSARDRLADHAAIERLATELLPALAAKVAATGLGELEVSEGDWHVRLRRPFGTAPGEGRRAGDRPVRAGSTGHDPHGRARADAVGALRTAPVALPTAGPSTNGSGPSRAGGSDTGHGDPAGAGRAEPVPGGPVPATSPAVGVFTPGGRAVPGSRVRAGDSLGTVNVLGVPQDVLAPIDAVVAAVLVEAGTPVEYGQVLVQLEIELIAGAR
jgi:biotin carboxyl carrier protein